MDEKRKSSSWCRRIVLGLMLAVIYVLSWAPVLALQHNGTIPGSYSQLVHRLYAPVNYAINRDERIRAVCWTYLKLWRKVIPPVFTCHIVDE